MDKHTSEMLAMSLSGGKQLIMNPLISTLHSIMFHFAGALIKYF